MLRRLQPPITTTINSFFELTNQDMMVIINLLPHDGLDYFYHFIKLDITQNTLKVKKLHILKKFQSQI